MRKGEREKRRLNKTEREGKEEDEGGKQNGRTRKRKEEEIRRRIQ
jgi:hypothetical protein